MNWTITLGNKISLWKGTGEYVNNAKHGRADHRMTVLKTLRFSDIKA